MDVVLIGGLTPIEGWEGSYWWVGLQNYYAILWDAALLTDEFLDSSLIRGRRSGAYICAQLYDVKAETLPYLEVRNRSLKTSKNYVCPV